MAKAAKRLWYVVRTNIKCEDKAARNLRQAGYRVYLPKMRKDIVHHRTKKRITRSFVLFNRYLFVGVPAENPNWYKLRACEGVECVLGEDGPEGRRYLPVPRETVASFIMAQRNLDFDATRRAEIKRKEIGRTEKQTLKMRFPVGSRFRVKKDWQHDHPFGGFYGQVVKVAGRRKIKAMMEIFATLVPIEIDPSDIEPVERAA